MGGHKAWLPQNSYYTFKTWRQREPPQPCWVACSKCLFSMYTTVQKEYESPIPTKLSEVISQHILFLYLQQTPIHLRTSVDLRHPPPPQPRAFDCTVYLVHYLAASSENGAACQAVSGQGRQAKRGKKGSFTTFLLKYKISSLFFVMFVLYFQYKLTSKEALISIFFLVHVVR